MIHHHLQQTTTTQSHLSLGPLDHEPPLQMIGRVRLSDLLAYDGVVTSDYSKAVEALSDSLTRRNAAIIELNCQDTAVLRCGLEASRFFFTTRSRNAAAAGVYVYRAGRALEDTDSSPPCMTDVYKCMGKAARAALSAIARHLRLRSDVFNYLLDDNPLPANEASSSVLVATYSDAALQNGKGVITGGMLTSNVETEKGLLTLITTDAPGIQVCDPNGHWYLADDGSSPGNLLLLSGRSLSHATAGLRPVSSYRAATDNTLINNSGGRTSLAFRLMPQSNAILDCSPVSAAGHVIPQSYVPVSVSQFMDDLSAEENVSCIRNDNANVPQNSLKKEPSLRSILSDPLSGAFLEDAMFVSCGHSFGGMMLRKVIEISKCALCNANIDSGSLIPNHALRAAATAVKYEDDKRLFHNSTLRKRRKEVGSHRENGDATAENGAQRVIQYPFTINEKVVIKGNRRTPDKFVGKEAIITSQCLNGWYLLKIIESGENVRLQYRSLRKLLISHSPSPPVQT
ncbi:uncharacterized protein LOC141679113 isoform X2 [Apium graveolens]|uniref:uncharacterized protein LOC141679113 isoform X2 n=1 Tax=Apium graveolens TaxID=4045 RepID=UPI003D7A3805